MDPDATLAELRKLLGGDHSGETAPPMAGHLLTRVCEAEVLFQALDEWIRKGGFLPRGWRKPAEWKEGEQREVKGDPAAGVKFVSRREAQNRYGGGRDPRPDTRA